MCNIYRKAPVLESLFNKVTALQACNFVKKRTLLKRDSNAGDFLWILRNFQEHLGTAASSFSSMPIGLWNTFEHILTVSWRILLNLRVNLYNLSQITEYFLTSPSVSSFICLSYLSKKVEPAVDMYNSKAYVVQKTHFTSCIGKKEPKVDNSPITLQCSIY